ncbi:MAG: DUF3592 domain-containing protein [Akkermansiaceae bacterium]
MEKPGKSKGASIYLIFIGLAVAAMGAVFVVLLWNSFQAAKQTRSWTEVEASVIESAVAERRFSKETAKEYSLKLLFDYQFEGKSFVGENLKRRENPWYRNRAKIEALVEKYPSGMHTTAFVNPENPSEALLAHDTKAGGYSIWFPGLFVVGGLGCMLRGVMNLAKKD